MGYYCEKNPQKECDGCMDCKPDPRYYCPVCRKEVYETVFVNDNGDVIGCENCAEIKEPHEVLNDETDER
jgi:hypothetical protein